MYLPDGVEELLWDCVVNFFHEAYIKLAQSAGPGGSSTIYSFNQEDNQDSLLDIIIDSLPDPIVKMDTSLSVSNSNIVGDYDEMIQEFLSEMNSLWPSPPSCGMKSNKRNEQRRPSLLEDLEEFVDVVGLDDLGSLQDMEVFSEVTEVPKFEEVRLEENVNDNVVAPVFTGESILPKEIDVPLLSSVNLNGESKIIKVTDNGMKITIKTANTRKKDDNVEAALEAGDVDSLLEQFEATEEANGSVNVSKDSTKPKELPIPTNMIEKLKSLRIQKRQSILIPPKPTVKKTKQSSESSNTSPKLRRLLQLPQEVRCDSAQLRREHDYCNILTPPDERSPDDKEASNRNKSVDENVNEVCKEDSNNVKTTDRDDFFDKIPDTCDNVKPQDNEKDSDDFDKLPSYLTCFTNKKHYRSNKISNTSVSSQSEHDANCSVKSERSQSKSVDSHHRSRSNSVSTCSTCSSSSSYSDSSSSGESSYSNRKSPRRHSDRKNRKRSRSRSRSRRVSSSSYSKHFAKSRSYSSSSHSSNDSRRFSRSRSRDRSRRGAWINRDWKRNPRRSPSYERNHLHRSRSPFSRNHYQRNSPRRRHRSRSFNMNYPHMPRISADVLQKKRRGIEERRVIYVGNIPEGTTRDYLRCRFQKFGDIEEVSLHFRDHKDNYGFVTFVHQGDAYDAFENGNKDPNLPKFNLCFGGRRQFCGSNYADLDDIEDECEVQWSIEKEPECSVPAKKTNSSDFDALLNAAKLRMKK